MSKNYNRKYFAYRATILTLQNGVIGAPFCEAIPADQGWAKYPFTMAPTSALAVQIGKRMKALREKKGLSQKGLAKVLGMTEKGYANLEQGRRFSSASLGKLADLYGLEVRDLFDFRENIPPEDLCQEFLHAIEEVLKRSTPEQLKAAHRALRILHSILR